jgi:ATP-dependent DNA helicase RecG
VHLLGKDETIRSVLPHYKIDALVRRVQMDHYDDRDRIDCNLIEAYDRLMAFIAKHLPDPFHLEGDARISLRDKIFREVVANFLVHREYMNAHPARLIIYNDRVETTNASNYRFEGILDPQNVVPFSKNPVISKFFAQLSWVEEIGSGMMNIGKYLPHYTPGGIPEYRDGPVFTTIIPIKTNWAADPVTEQDAGSSRKTENEIIDMLKKGSYITRTDLLKMLSERVGSKLVERVGSKLVETQLKILILIKEKPGISKRELSGPILLRTPRDLSLAMFLSTAVLLRPILSDKGGHWEVIDN